MNLDMGAYTVASASSFNGFKPPNATYVMCMAPIPATKEKKKKKNKMKKSASTEVCAFSFRYSLSVRYSRSLCLFVV